MSAPLPAFDTAVLANRRMLLAKITSMVGPDDAEDVLQDAMVRAWRNFDSFRGQSAVGTWLFTIAVNQARNFLAAKRQGMKSLTDTVEPPELASNETPEQIAIAESTLAMFHVAHDALPESHRDVYDVCGTQEVSMREAAAYFGVNENTIRSRLFRARRTLAAAVGA